MTAFQRDRQTERKKEKERDRGFYFNRKKKRVIRIKKGTNIVQYINYSL